MLKLAMSEEDKPKNELTIAEALNELKLLVKRFDERVRRIQRYSSKMAKNEDEIDGQQAWVDEQRQSANDILARYHAIKQAIQRSNLETVIEYGDKGMTIADALVFKQQTYEMQARLLAAFTPALGERQVQSFLGRQTGAFTQEELTQLKLVPHLFYDEKEIHGAREGLIALHSNLDVLIEASNHRTVIHLE
jgi:hypothetical protein